MDGNPFFIRPAGSTAPGQLSGIGDIIAQNRENERIRQIQDAELKRQEDFRRAQAEAFGIDPVTGQPIAQQEEFIPRISRSDMFDAIMEPQGAKYEQVALEEMGITPDKYQEVKDFIGKMIPSQNEGRRQLILDRVKAIQERGGNAADTAKLLNMPREEADKVLNVVDMIVDRQALRRMAAIDPVATQAILKKASETGDTDFTTKMRLFEKWRNMEPGEEKDAYGMMLGAVPRTRSIEEALTLEEEKAKIRSGEFENKQAVRQRTEPEIEKAIAKSKAKGAEEVDADKMINDFESELPALEDVTNKLVQLSDIATYTAAGRGFNSVARELGLNPGKGADARAAYIATVNNEVLPMLRRMLGAAFTEKEGEKVVSLLGDPNSSPSEKKAQLQAYMDAKRRELDSLRRKKIGQFGVPSRSDEELFRKYGI